MERKYRQRGYQDSRQDRGKDRSRPRQENFGPRTPQMPGKRLVSRCARCGKVLHEGFDPNGQCPHCGFELHSCKQCSHFDTSARFECTQPILVRIAKKDSRNECRFYSPRVTLERQTSPDSSRGDDPRKAFEALFKK
jgi:predicted RNA-binding Zn-ribbon protein involved in translation (DUF1610 family)